MIKSWMEPSIRTRIKELISESEENTKEEYNRFIELLDMLVNKPDEAKNIIPVLEVMYIETVNHVEFGYRNAIIDMLRLKESLK